MFSKVITATVLAGTVCLTVIPTAAYDAVPKSVNYKQEPVFTPLHGKTLPPIGFVNFCARNEAECRSLDKTSETNLDLTELRWQQLIEVNAYVNAKIAPVSDMELYSQPEHWVIPENAGDCEDYVLLKKRYLEGLGFAVENMLITVVLDEEGEGHAVLTVKTNAGDFILDNRRDEIRRWSETRYQFIKRQSQINPRIWIALTPKQSRGDLLISGGS